MQDKITAFFGIRGDIIKMLKVRRVLQDTINGDTMGSLCVTRA